MLYIKVLEKLKVDLAFETVCKGNMNTINEKVSSHEKHHLE